MLIDPLDHLLAPLMLEIHVDIGRLAALLGDEALEQEIVAAGIDRGDAEHIADGRVRRRSAPLAEDAARPGEADDAVHREEVGRVIELADQGQLMLQRGGHLLGHALGIAVCGALPGQPLQGFLRGQRLIVALFGILIAQLVEREAAAIRDLTRPGQSLGPAREEPVHFGGRLQIAVGMALAPGAERIDGDIVADRGDDILQDAAAGFVEEHVIGHDGGHADPRGERRQLPEAHLVIGPPPQRQAEIGAGPEGIAQAPQAQTAGLVGKVRHQDRDQALAVGDQIIPFEVAARPARAPLAQREQAAEP